MESTKDSVLSALTGRVAVEEWDGSEYVTLPMWFSTGNLIEVKVTQMSATQWIVSDQNAAIAELALHGLDLDSKQVAAESWSALVRQMRVETPILVDVGRYEIAGASTRDNLGRTILEVAHAAQRAEMLKVLAPSYRARTFREEVVARVGAANLPMIPNAPMPTRHDGKRQITVKIERSSPIYMQAISASRSRLDGFDKAQAIFSTAAVDTSQLVAVLSDRVKLSSWQWETLRDSGQPIYERELDDYLAHVAAVVSN